MRRSTSPTGTGAGPLATRAETELRATGARPRRVMLAGVESLTASERRVAELAADGLNQPRDRAIAVRHRTHGRGTPDQRVPQARPGFARSAPGGDRPRHGALPPNSGGSVRGVSTVRTRIRGVDDGSRHTPDLDLEPAMESTLLTNTCATGASSVLLRTRPDRHPAARGDDRREPAPHGRALRRTATRWSSATRATARPTASCGSRSSSRPAR